MRDWKGDAWLVVDALSWCIGLVLLPLGLLYRTLKLVKQLATDT